MRISVLNHATQNIIHLGGKMSRGRGWDLYINKWHWKQVFDTVEVGINTCLSIKTTKLLLQNSVHIWLNSKYSKIYGQPLNHFYYPNCMFVLLFKCNYNKICLRVLVGGGGLKLFTSNQPSLNLIEFVPWLITIFTS